MDADEQAVQIARERLGLDQPMYQQFLDYIGGLFRGDMGTSFATNQPVTQEIAQKIGPTAQLAVFGMAIILLVGLPMGIIGAVLTRNGHRAFEVIFSGSTGAMASIPQYRRTTT